MMLAGLDNCIDVIVPRGGKGLVARVQTEAACRCSRTSTATATSTSTAPPILTWRRTVLLNAKMRRTGVCGAAETLLVDRACAARAARAARQDAARRRLRSARRGRTRKVDTRVKAATEEDWATEFLDAIIAAKVVDGVTGAIEHIETHGSHHTDAIITDDKARRRKIPARGRFRPLCCIMRRRSSPMAASSASAPRSASPLDACMRAARSASNSSPLSNIVSAERGRSGRESDCRRMAAA